MQHEDIIENLENSEFLMATEKMSSNKVFSFGRDHGYHGRLLSHGVVAEQSLQLKRIHLLDTVLLLKMEMPYYPL